MGATQHGPPVCFRPFNATCGRIGGANASDSGLLHPPPLCVLSQFCAWAAVVTRCSTRSRPAYALLTLGPPCMGAMASSWPTESNLTHPDTGTRPRDPVHLRRPGKRPSKPFPPPWVALLAASVHPASSPGSFLQADRGDKASPPWSGPSIQPALESNAAASRPHAPSRSVAIAPPPDTRPCPCASRTLPSWQPTLLQGGLAVRAGGASGRGVGGGLRGGASGGGASGGDLCGCTGVCVVLGSRRSLLGEAGPPARPAPFCGWPPPCRPPEGASPRCRAWGAHGLLRVRPPLAPHPGATTALLPSILTGPLCGVSGGPRRPAWSGCLSRPVGVRPTWPAGWLLPLRLYPPPPPGSSTFAPLRPPRTHLPTPRPTHPPSRPPRAPPCTPYRAAARPRSPPRTGMRVPRRASPLRRHLSAVPPRGVSPLGACGGGLFLRGGTGARGVLPALFSMVHRSLPFSSRRLGRAWLCIYRPALSFAKRMRVLGIFGVICSSRRQRLWRACGDLWQCVKAVFLAACVLFPLAGGRGGTDMGHSPSPPRCFGRSLSSPCSPRTRDRADRAPHSRDEPPGAPAGNAAETTPWAAAVVAATQVGGTRAPAEAGSGATEAAGEPAGGTRAGGSSRLSHRDSDPMLVVHAAPAPQRAAEVRAERQSLSPRGLLSPGGLVCARVPSRQGGSQARAITTPEWQRGLRSLCVSCNRALTTRPEHPVCHWTCHCIGAARPPPGAPRRPEYISAVWQWPASSTLRLEVQRRLCAQCRQA